jgi:lipopolysaccharide biosynthesis glycosyltransferase
LVVELDVLETEAIDLNGYALAAVNGSKLKFVLDGEFIIREIGISPESEYFNSGVMLMNLQKWRSEELKEKCLDVARKYPTEIRSHDQTLLNAIFANNYARLPQKYNCAWLGYIPKPVVANDMILHYVGSPKPWDIGGKILHAGYKTWRKYLDGDWSKAYYHIRANNLVRTWKIRRSYIRFIMKKIKG